MKLFNSILYSLLVNFLVIGQQNVTYAMSSISTIPAASSASIVSKFNAPHCVSLFLGSAPTKEVALHQIINQAKKTHQLAINSLPNNKNLDLLTPALQKMWTAITRANGIGEFYRMKKVSHDIENYYWQINQKRRSDIFDHPEFHLDVVSTQNTLKIPDVESALLLDLVQQLKDKKISSAQARDILLQTNLLIHLKKHLMYMLD